MGMIATARHFHVPKRTSSERLRTATTLRDVGDKIEGLSEEPGMKFAHYRPHRLPEIAEVSTSTGTTVSRKKSTNLAKEMDGATDIHISGKHVDNLALKNTITSYELNNLASSKFAQPPSPRRGLRSLAPSASSISVHEIPRRKSSMSALNRNLIGSRQTSLQDLRSDRPDHKTFLSSHGHAESPLRHAIEQGAQSSAALCSSPPRTFVRTTTPFYLLDNDHPRNPRLEISVRLPSPLFVGGGTVEGQIELKVDPVASKKLQLKPLFISRLSVDIIGVEEVEDGRRHVFLSLATELFDSQHPPPPSLTCSQSPERGSELYWRTKPSTTIIPFCINLPLKLGPPPYSSRQASIRYLLCPSAVIKIGEKRSAVRQIWTIQMLTVYDPEKALVSLPSPLLASDTLNLSHSPIIQSIKLTAGLHRQTWVSGGAVFTDVHINNNSDKTLKRIELSLEKSILWFSHSVPSAAEKRANNLRLPAKIDTEIVCKSVVKKNKDWKGILPQASEVRTCEIDIPKGHVTIGDGRYFEVRYFVKVTVVATRNKSVSVQLPVTIIHINSLDIVPNSVAQVAASIEAKRLARATTKNNKITYPSHTPGQAFTAARRQSCNQLNHAAESKTTADLHSLMQDLDNSPRRGVKVENTQFDQNLAVELDATNEITRQRPPACQRHLTLRPSCYHCHLLYTAHAAKSSPYAGPKLPRLQVSTSGLGFSESEFEIPPDSPPRKVMLSEKERQMINQQRELRLQRDLGQQKNRNLSQDQIGIHSTTGFIGWQNIAVLSDAVLEHTNFPESKRQIPTKRPSQRRSVRMRPLRGSQSMTNGMGMGAGRSRSRSRTNPERMRANFSDGPHARKPAKASGGKRSLDRNDGRVWYGYSLAENDVFSPNKTSIDQPRRIGEAKISQAQYV